MISEVVYAIVLITFGFLLGKVHSFWRYQKEMDRIKK